MVIKFHLSCFFPGKKKKKIPLDILKLATEICRKIPYKTAITCKGKIISLFNFKFAAVNRVCKGAY